MEEVENMDFEFDFTPSIMDEEESGESVAEEEISEEAEQPETKAEQEEQPEEAENQGEPKEEVLLEIKYNGELKKITLDEARTLAQKGMNYDHIKTENERLSGSAKVLERLAKAVNQSPEEYLNTLNARLAADEEKQQIKDVMTKYGVNEETAKRIHQDRKENAKQQEDYSSIKNKLFDMEIQEKARQIWADFTKEHPEIKNYNSLPEEVQLAVKAGKDLTDAYNAYEIKQLKEKLAKSERQEKNKGKSTGSMKDSGSSAAETDPFLKGFLGNF